MIALHSAADSRQRRRLLLTAITAASGLAVRAQAARDSALRLLCSGSAGSIPDIVARTVAEQLAPVSGGGALVDNRPGAAARLSVAALKAVASDGSALLVAQGAIATVYPFLYDKPDYVAATDLQPVTLASEMVLALAVGPAVPAEVSTVAGFIDRRAALRLASTSARLARARCPTCSKPCCSTARVCPGSTWPTRGGRPP